jgi:hypothetical protein
MITLTTPASINSVLGGNVPVAYGAFVLAPFTMDAKTLQITGIIRLTAAASPDMQPILGNLRINGSSGQLTIEVAQLDFYRQVQLSGPQITAVLTIITNAQNALEAGLVTLGVIAGAQSTGA